MNQMEEIYTGLIIPMKFNETAQPSFIKLIGAGTWCVLYYSSPNHGDVVLGAGRGRDSWIEWAVAQANVATEARNQVRPEKSRKATDAYILERLQIPKWKEMD